MSEGHYQVRIWTQAKQEAEEAINKLLPSPHVLHQSGLATTNQRPYSETVEEYAAVCKKAIDAKLDELKMARDHLAAAEAMARGVTRI